VHQAARFHRQAIDARNRFDALGELAEIGAPGEREGHVLDHGQRLEEREVLEHHADADGARMRGIGDPDRGPFPAHLPGIGLDAAVDDLHQGGLAGTVLAEHSVNLPRHDGQIDVLVRHARRVDLRDPAQVEQWLARLRGRRLARHSRHSERLFHLPFFRGPQPRFTRRRMPTPTVCPPLRCRAATDASRPLDS
jgi:hypothetical protein